MQKRIMINIKKQQLLLYQEIIKQVANMGSNNPSSNNIEQNYDFGMNQNECKQYEILEKYQISTALNGINNLEGSGGTPIGRHYVADKIGEDAPLNTVFVGRKKTGEIYSDALAQSNPNRDWILTRIIRLAGLDVGVNLGENDEGCCDTFSRFIYIHGTPDSNPMGIPLSHGCIRMHNNDIVSLFKHINKGDLVDIVEGDG